MLNPDIVAALQGMAKQGKRSKNSDEKTVRGLIVQCGFPQDIEGLRLKAQRNEAKSRAFTLAAQAWEAFQSKDYDGAAKLATEAKGILLSIRKGTQGPADDENED
jgi:hypothetical protein